MRLNKIIGGIIVGGAIVGISIPVVYQSQINKFIALQKENLKNFNINVEEKRNNDSFFKVNREYVLTVTDITPIVKKVYPDISYGDLRDLKEGFDNVKFLVKIDFLKYPVYHKDAIKVSLYALNKDITEEMQKDQVGKEILKYIREKAFSVIMDINNLKIEKAKLKDINLDLKEVRRYKTENVKILTKNIMFINNGEIDFKGKYVRLSYSKIYNNSGKKYKSSFEINNFDYSLQKQNDLNSITKTYIKSIVFENKEPIRMNNVKFVINGIKSSTSLNTSAKGTNVINKFSIDNLSANLYDNYIELKKFVFNISFLNIDTEALKMIMRNKNEKMAEKYGLKIINHGFKIKVDPLSFKKLEIEGGNLSMSIDPVFVKFNAKLEKNDFSQYTNPEMLLNKVYAKLYLETSKKNIDLITKINPQSAMVITPILQMKNNKAVIEVEYKNSHIYSKGIKIF